MEGFGASDTTISDTRPYLQENAANFNQTTFFTPWNFHQSGVTFGYYQGRTAVRALLLSGVRLHNDKDALEPFGRREPFTNSLPLSKHSGVDFQLLVNRTLNFNAGSVTFYYYHGNMNIPIINPDGTFQPDRAFRNDFNRVAFYASYPVAKRLTLLGGVLRGRDGEHKKVGGIMSPSALVCWCLHRTEVWIPFPEGLLPVFVENLSSDLQ
jgi:hypothetical protein